MDCPDNVDTSDTLPESPSPVDSRVSNDSPSQTTTSPVPDYSHLFSNNSHALTANDAPVELFLNPSSFDEMPGTSASSSSAFFSLNQPSCTGLPSLAAASASSSITLDPRVHLFPVSSDLVEQEAEPIFLNFVQERFLVEQSRQNIPSNLPSPTTGRPNGRFQMTAEERQVAHRLVELSDIIDREHGDHFNLVLDYLSPSRCNVSEHFAGVANSLFKDGDRNWGRIVALFYLGYRMCLACLRRGVSDFLYSLGSTFVSILRGLNLVDWVAQRGGWRTVLLLVCNYVETISSFYSGAITIASVLLVTWLFSHTMGFGKRS